MTPAEHFVKVLEPISLAEMDRVALLDRIDTKYVCAARQLEELLPDLATEYRVLEVEALRWSPYQTLYFDTPDCECFLQHHNGKLNRFKFRMRQYVHTGLCFLEVKRKSNRGRTEKQRRRIAAIEPRLPADAVDFIRSATGRVLDLQPQLWSRFHRLTLVSRHRAERVTIDCDLAFRGNARAAGFPGLAILEVKQERDDRRATVRELLRQARIRPLRVSKYCLGSLLLNPGLKSNRFKAKLRAIRKVSPGQGT